MCMCVFQLTRYSNCTRLPVFPMSSERVTTVNNNDNKQRHRDKSTKETRAYENTNNNNNDIDEVIAGCEVTNITDGLIIFYC